MDGDCRGLGPVVRIVKKGILPIFQILIPIGLILMGTIDLGKAVIASDEKEIKEQQGKLIKRFIYAAVVFLIFTLVRVVMGIVSESKASGADTDTWLSCWNRIK